MKVCDFGLARATHWDSEMTEYVVTRYYRAPEIMLACRNEESGQNYDAKG